MRLIHVAQFSGFFGAQLSNCTLIYLIFTKSERLLGGFRHIMCVFAMYALFYSWVEVLTQPMTFIKGPTCAVIVDSRFKYEKTIGRYIVCLFCACFALCISLLALQFFYRYLALCRPSALHKLRGVRFVLLFVPCIAVFFLWYLAVFFGMESTLQKKKFLWKEFLAYYSEDSFRIAFIASMFWEYDENGKRVWNLLDCFSAIWAVVVIVNAVLFNYSLLRSEVYRYTKNAKTMLSARTRDLNRQLFCCLTLQTVIPFFLMYCPVGMLYVCPFVGIEMGWYVTFPAVSSCLYPSIEPLIAIFCIGDFRRAILPMHAKNHRVAVTSTDSQRREAPPQGATT